VSSESLKFLVLRATFLTGKQSGLIKSQFDPAALTKDPAMHLRHAWNDPP
jgi:hypothetical protein